ncbi:MAG: hypothetical protein K2H47_00930, partial [Muribaculaceae bacterium]|nr:hypothetical protein [Muribaculaceae bacterium]
YINNDKNNDYLLMACMIAAISSVDIPFSISITSSFLSFGLPAFPKRFIRALSVAEYLLFLNLYGSTKNFSLFFQLS